jgi:hypothetical protein
MYMIMNHTDIVNHHDVDKIIRIINLLFKITMVTKINLMFNLNFKFIQQYKISLLTELWLLLIYTQLNWKIVSPQRVKVLLLSAITKM